MENRHETIYRRIRRYKRQGGNLASFTRIMSKVGRKRYRSRPARGILPGKRHISERPESVNDRSRIGDWEGDTVMGKDTKHCLLTLVERKAGFTVIRILPDRAARAATDAALSVIRRTEHTFNTITFDNGTEFHDYKELEKDTGSNCYFATPYHSWERGTNENTKGLMRQYLPKGLCLANVTQAQCDWIADQLNQAGSAAVEEGGIRSHSVGTKSRREAASFCGRLLVRACMSKASPRWGALCLPQRSWRERHPRG